MLTKQTQVCQAGGVWGFYCLNFSVSLYIYIYIYIYMSLGVFYKSSERPCIIIIFFLFSRDLDITKVQS